MRKKCGMILLAVLLVVSLLGQTVLAKPSDEIGKEKDKVEDEKKKNQEKLDNLNEQIDELAGEQAEYQEELEALNMEIVEIMASINILEEEIREKEAEIEQAKADLAVAIEREEKQYEDTKSRIVSMYEGGRQDTYLSLLFESRNLADLLNRLEFVEQLYNYDNKVLCDYQQAKQEVIELKELLEMEEDELQTSKNECELERQELEVAAAELEKICTDYQNRIAEAKKQAKNYANTIKKQNEEIKKLQKKQQEAIAKELEEAKKAAATANGGGNGGGGGTKYTGSDYTVDTNIISNASGSQTGKDVALYAVQFLGNPYKAGGSSLTNGTDCSGFTSAVYAHFGISVPRTSYGQRSAGVGVEYKDAQPGDIICYAGHVALYIGGGLIVHASTEKTGIKISNATYKSIICVRRVI